MGDDASPIAPAPCKEQEPVVPKEEEEESFGLSDEDFAAIMSRELQTDPLAAEYPEVFALAPRCLVQWRRRYRGNPSLWKRLFHKERVLKEFMEAAPIIDAVIKFVEHASDVRSEDEKFTIVDLASGKGFLSMFLSELLPPSKVRRCVLMDKAWPMHGTAPKPHHMSWEHIYGETTTTSAATKSATTINSTPEGNVQRQKYIDTWPIPLTTSRQDLKHGNQRRNLEAKFFCDGPVILLAVHLCGTLSLKAIQFFNDHPDTIRFFALKPCCLPGMIHAKRHEVFSFFAGNKKEGGHGGSVCHHSFDSKLVCVRGKWNKDKWCGPNRQQLAPIFGVWCHNLFLGICTTTTTSDGVVDEGTTTTTGTGTGTTTTMTAVVKKAQVTIRVQHGGGYQNEFIFAERPLPATEAVWETLEKHNQSKREPKQDKLN